MITFQGIRPYSPMVQSSTEKSKNLPLFDRISEIFILSFAKVIRVLTLCAQNFVVRLQSLKVNDVAISMLQTKERPIEDLYKALICSDDKSLSQPELETLWADLLENENHTSLATCLKYATAHKLKLSDEALIQVAKLAMKNRKTRLIKVIKCYVQSLDDSSRAKRIVNEALLTSNQRADYLQKFQVTWKIKGVNNDRVAKDPNLPKLIEFDPKMELKVLNRIAAAQDIPDDYRLDTSSDDNVKLVPLKTCRKNIQGITLRIERGNAFGKGPCLSDEDREVLASSLREILVGLQMMDDAELIKKYVGMLGVGFGHCREGIFGTVNSVLSLIRAHIQNLSEAEGLGKLAKLVQLAKTDIVKLLIDYSDAENQHQLFYYMNILGRYVEADGAPKTVMMDSFGDRKFNGLSSTPTEAVEFFEASYSQDYLINYIEQAVKRDLTLMGQFYDLISHLITEGDGNIDHDYSLTKKGTELLLKTTGYIV